MNLRNLLSPLSSAPFFCSSFAFFSLSFEALPPPPPLPSLSADSDSAKLEPFDGAAAQDGTETTNCGSFRGRMALTGVDYGKISDR